MLPAENANSHGNLSPSVRCRSLGQRETPTLTWACYIIWLAQPLLSASHGPMKQDFSQDLQKTQCICWFGTGLRESKVSFLTIRLARSQKWLQQVTYNYRQGRGVGKVVLTSMMACRVSPNCPLYTFQMLHNGTNGSVSAFQYWFEDIWEYPVCLRSP